MIVCKVILCNVYSVRVFHKSHNQLQWFYTKGEPLCSKLLLLSKLAKIFPIAINLYCPPIKWLVAISDTVTVMSTMHVHYVDYIIYNYIV